MATLFVLQGREIGRRFELEQDVLSLGRDRSNDIQLADHEVSRRHAEIRADEEGYVVVDLGSSNGTYINGRRITQQRLVSGDRLQLGRTLLLFTDAQRRQPLDHGVEIVGRSAEGSRVISAFPPAAAAPGAEAPAADSPWLVAARNHLQVMYRTALAVSHTLDIDQLLTRLIDLIFECVPADRGCIMLVDSQTQELTPAVSRTRRPEAGMPRIAISRTILDYVLTHREGILTSDARDDARWKGEGSIVALGVREAICVPMQGRYGVVGAIYVDTCTPPGRVLPGAGSSRFTEEDLRLMVAIGHQAALAVEDTTFYSALVQAERLAAMGQTIATLSHHIKNILQGMRGGGYLIEQGLSSGDAEAIRRGWRMVERNQERISNLVLDMLTFSKDRVPERVPADLNETIGDVVELMKTRAAEAQVELLWTPRSDLPRFNYDPDLLHRAILNVVINAIDACERRAGAQVAIGVEWSPGDRLVHIVVSDNGEGIAPEDLPRIFSLFESRKGARGTGLGLPVSQKILREHGGEIRVESTPGQGSRFYLELPAQVSDQPLTTPLPSDTIPAPS